MPVAERAVALRRISVFLLLLLYFAFTIPTAAQGEGTYTLHRAIVGSPQNLLFVEGEIDSLPNALYRVDFFVGATCDTASPEHIGSMDVPTDSNGHGEFAGWLSGEDEIETIQFLTATANNHDTPGDSGEFSPCRQIEVNHPPVARASSNSPRDDEDLDGMEAVEFYPYNDLGVSYDPEDGTNLNYEWYVGTEVVSIEESPTVDLPAGVYNVTLRIYDTLGAMAEAHIVVQVTSSIIPPTPLPDNAAPQINAHPMPSLLSWSVVTWAAGYDVQIATDADFNNIVLEASVSAQAHPGIVPELWSPDTYYWRVRAVRSNGQTTGWSKSDTFVIFSS